MRVLITGIAGKVARLVAEELVAGGHEVIGIDRRAWEGAPTAIAQNQVDIRKRAAEDVFRKHRPEGVIHMATVTHLTEQSEDRYRINLQGTRAVFDHCNAYGAKVAVFVGRHTYYGASPEAPLYHREDDPPMGLSAFAELADLVAADLYAGSALWRFPDLKTSVLRLCYTLGPARTGTLATFLRGPNVPTVLGFDPLFQMLHERDAAHAVCLTVLGGLRGVFNVAGPPPLPLSKIIELTGRRQLPVPELVFRFALGRFGLPRLPEGALAHIKYPVIIDATAFREAAGFGHQIDEDRTMEEFKEGRAREPRATAAG
jgi:UDP-glucose 4-epimerase